MNKLSNFRRFRIFFKVPRKKVIKVKTNTYFLHFCVCRSGTRDISDARLGNSASRLGTLQIMLPDNTSTDFECLKDFDCSEFLSSFIRNDRGLKFYISSVSLCFPKQKQNMV